MNPLVSICIPTFQRPDLLRLAIESCLMQSYSPVEILIGDDSLDEQTAELVQSWGAHNIRYFRNSPSLGQANNVNSLFDAANGSRLVLLHDDDLLVDNALEKLSNCWEDTPGLDVAHGKQHSVDMNGVVDEARSRSLNRDYHRISKNAGLQNSPVWAGLTGQFPNNGYMIRTELAQQIRYRDAPDVGDACDFDFGIRVSMQCKNIFFLDEYTSLYRCTDLSISSNNNYANLSYSILESLELPDELDDIRNQRLVDYADTAINQWILIGAQKKAREVYFSCFYKPSRISTRGLIQGVLLFLPSSWSSWLLHTIRFWS